MQGGAKWGWCLMTQAHLGLCTPPQGPMGQCTIDAGHKLSCGCWGGGAGRGRVTAEALHSRALDSVLKGPLPTGASGDVLLLLALAVLLLAGVMPWTCGLFMP